MSPTPDTKFCLGATDWLNPNHMPKPLVLRGREMKVSCTYTTMVRSKTIYLTKIQKLECFSKQEKKPKSQKNQCEMSMAFFHIIPHLPKISVTTEWLLTLYFHLKFRSELQILISKCWWIFIFMYCTYIPKTKCDAYISFLMIPSYFSPPPKILVLNSHLRKKFNHSTNCPNEGFVLKTVPSLTLPLYTIYHLPKLAIFTSYYQIIATSFTQAFNICQFDNGKLLFSLPIVSLLSI